MKIKSNPFIGLLVMITFNLYGQDYKWEQEIFNFVKVNNITQYFHSNVDLDDRVKEIEVVEKAIDEVLKFINETEYTKAIDFYM